MYVYVYSCIYMSLVDLVSLRYSTEVSVAMSGEQKGVGMNFPARHLLASQHEHGSLDSDVREIQNRMNKHAQNVQVT